LAESVARKTGSVTLMLLSLKSSVDVSVTGSNWG